MQTQPLPNAITILYSVYIIFKLCNKPFNYILITSF